MNIIKKTCLINLLFLMTIVGFGLYPSLSNAQSDIVSVDPLTHKLNRTNFVGSVAVFKGLYIGTNEVLTTGASSINTLATTNFVLSQGFETKTITNGLATTSFVNTAVANITPASIGAVSNTAIGIKNAGGLTNGQVLSYSQYPLALTNAAAFDASGTAAALVAAYSNTMTTTVNKAGTAWQNPASATNWTWTSDGTQITLTGYTGPNAVVIPDMLDGLPVTGFGAILQIRPITSISGGANITTIGQSSFAFCDALTSVSLPNVTTVGGNAFIFCDALTSVSLPNVTTIGDGAFYICAALTSVYIGGQNAPAEGVSVYLDAPNVINYVTNPQATGWGTTWNGRPVVRLPVYADTFYGSGASLTDITAAQVGAVPTNDARYLAAWQNPASATNWTWTSDGTNITLTGYNFTSMDVVIPDMLDGLPVTGFGTIFSPSQAGSAITSISGGNNVKRIDDMAFAFCAALISISLPSVTIVGDYAFWNEAPDPAALTTVYLPSVTSIGKEAFEDCTALISISLPSVTNVDNHAFRYSSSLSSVYFSQNAPAEQSDVYFNTPNVTNYVTNPQATGWGATWNARPVVRMPVYADEYWRLGTNLTTLLAAKVDQTITNGLATTTYVNNATQGLVTASVTNGLASTSFVNTAVANITPASIGAISNTALGIKNAGGVINNNPTSVTLETNLTVAGSLAVSNGAVFNGNVIIESNLVVNGNLYGNSSFMSGCPSNAIPKSPITNEFSIPFVTTIPTNSPFLLARLNESQILTQLMSKAQYGSGATATVYVLPTFQSDFSAATSTNDILVNSSWNTTNISFTIPIGGGLAIAVTSGYLNITNTIIFIRTVIP